MIDEPVLHRKQKYTVEPVRTPLQLRQKAKRPGPYMSHPYFHQIPALQSAQRELDRLNGSVDA